MKIKLTCWDYLSAHKKSIGIASIIIATLAIPIAADDTLEVDGFYENASNVREDRGLSKFRNTVQFEFVKDLGFWGAFSNVTFNSTLRGTYDGVYDLNDDEWGANAGGSIMIEDQVVGAVAHGQGLGSSNINSPYFGAGLPPGHALGFDTFK